MIDMSILINKFILRGAILWIGVAICTLALTQLAAAHKAEQGLILLLPTDVYIAAGVSSFILTVIVVALLPVAVTNVLFKPISVIKIGGWPNSKKATSACATLVLFFLLLVGLQGPNDPQANLLSLTIWSGWWIGLVALHGLLGNLWSWINPWTGLFAFLDAILRSPIRPKMPKALGVWPAIVIFLLFSSFSIADPAPADPGRLTSMVFGYWLFTLAGMLLFGDQQWTRHFECFTIFFWLISKLSPLQIGSRIRIGMPGWALLSGFKYSTSIAIFCLIILGSGSFDGLNETFWWLAAIDVNPLEFPGRTAIILETTIGFLLANLLLCAVFASGIYLGTSWANMGSKSCQTIPFKSAFDSHALSLLPIGFGFHLAHFLPTFLVSTQYNFAAMIDPFGTGADYLSLGKINIYVGFLSVSHFVRWIWLSQAGIIVLSHVLAILIAHKTSRQLFPDRPKAMMAELPLTAFMIAYTIFGLWLLAAPRGT
jgi:hypothetical protein